MRLFAAIFVTLVFPSLVFAAETATVLKVIDGDTLRVRYHNKNELVRLIGIDAPESQWNDKAVRDAKRRHTNVAIINARGEKSTKYVRGLISPGATVTLEFDQRKRDDYKRLLAYVYLSDRRMLNEILVKNGYARLMTIEPNTKYALKLKQAARPASNKP